jgi:NTP pyrophosphatase (non-canonical NTP hydrolase)
MHKIIEKLLHFRDERNWKQYHTPRNLIEALSVEVGELMELFLWNNKPSAHLVEEELADVLIYSLYIINYYGFDIQDIIEKKMKKNGDKYPV